MKNIIRSVINGIGFDIVRLSNSNSDFSAHLNNVLRDKKIDCVVDVGANSGQYGRFLRRMGYKGFIVSFEPVKSVFEKLAFGAADDPKWICYNLALGDAAERKEINVYASTVFSSFLAATDYSKGIWNSLEGVSSETVSVATFDSLYPEIAARTSCKHIYLKMDTQGYDLNVFRGALGSLDKVEALQSEVSLLAVYENMPDTYGVLSAFHQSGYFISGMYPINRDKSLAVIEYDCVLVKMVTAPASN